MWGGWFGCFCLIGFMWWFNLCDVYWYFEFECVRLGNVIVKEEEVL